MFSDEVLKGIAQAKARMERQSKSATSRFGVVSSGGGYYEGGEACHGRLSSIEPVAGRTRAVVVTTTNQPDSPVAHGNNTPELVQQYADYLTKHSVFADCFLGVEDGYYLIDCNQPANKMAAACVATRAAWERSSGVAKLIVDLFNAGVNPHLALFLGNACTISSKAETIAWSRAEEDHHCLESNYFSFKDLGNLINNTPKFLLPNYSTHSSYRGINKLFLDSPAERSTGGPQDWLTENLVPGKAAPVKNSNPFPVHVPPPTYTDRKFIPYLDALAMAIEAAPTLMKKALS